MGLSALDQHASQQTQETPARNGGVTELVLSQDCPQQTALILPMVAFLSQQAKDRWITWIAPTGINKAMLENYGIDSRQVRLIHPGLNKDQLWIIWEALAAGNSHTVLASPGKLTDKELRQLEDAAQQGKTQGLLLRMR